MIERLGAGGMGVVYAAFDPELDRRVALKVLRPERSEGPGDSDGHARLVREAKAMAQLTSPYVITVHDVGVEGGHVFVAMELVDGPTLQTWSETHTEWREVLEMYRRAGSGLAAAHRAGLVHRDFKPQNVMIGADGRPRVMDFGLARASGTHIPEPTVPSRPPTHSFEERMTVTGALLGTPLYMSPEQWSRADVDARSDQFSFCIALWEALYRVRPFDGESIPELVLAVSTGRRAPIPKTPRLPRRIRAALERGLAGDRDQRFATMDELLTALDPKRITRRRRVFGVALVSVAGLTGAYAFGTRRVPAPTASADPCPTVETAAGEIWTASRRAEVDQALRATNRAFAGDAADDALARLDRWAHGWARARVETCTAHFVRHETSQELFDLQVDCYDRLARYLDASTRVLVEEPDIVASATNISAALPSLAVCGDEEWLRARKPLPKGEGARAAIERAQASVLHALVLIRAGQLEKAEPIVDDALAIARRADYPPLLSRALFASGRLHHVRGRNAEAEGAMNEALSTALAGGDDWQAAKCAIELVTYIVRDGERPAESDRWLTMAQGLIQKLGSPPDLTVWLHRVEAELKRDRGDFEGALASARQALALAEDFFEPDDPNLANAHDMLGLVLHAMGKADEGLDHLERCLAIERKSFGPSHPRVAASMTNLAITYCSLGRIGECIDNLEAALATYERIYGPDSIEIVEVLTNLGEAKSIQGDAEAQLELNRRALEIRSRVYGEGHLETAKNLVNGGAALRGLGRHEESVEWLERAREIQRRFLDAGYPELGRTLLNLGMTFHELGRDRDAVTTLEQSRSIMVEALGPEHPNVGFVDVNLGIALAAAGDLTRGLATAETGVAILATVYGEHHGDVLSSRMELARILLAAGRRDEAVDAMRTVVEIGPQAELSTAVVAAAKVELGEALPASARDEARELIETAHRELVAAGETKHAARAERWLATH